MNKKRGLSPVIATALILILTFAAIAIIASVIIPFVSDNLDKSTECIDYREYLQFEEDLGFNCFDGSQRYGVSIQTKADDELHSNFGGFKLLFSVQGNIDDVNIEEGSSESCDPEGIKMYGSDCGSLGTLELPGSGGARTYVVDLSNSAEVYSSVEVHPVLKNGRVCESSDVVSLSLCQGVSFA